MCRPEIISNCQIEVFLLRFPSQSRQSYRLIKRYQQSVWRCHFLKHFVIHPSRRFELTSLSHSNSNISMSQCRSIIHSSTRHGYSLSSSLNLLNNFQFLFSVSPCENDIVVFEKEIPILCLIVFQLISSYHCP